MPDYKRLLCLLLTVLLAGLPAMAEVAADLGGDFSAYMGAPDDGYVDDGSMAAPTPAPTPEPVYILDADLVIGYVAQSNASMNPFRCKERDLVSMNQLVFESLVALDDSQKPVPMLADNWTHEGKYWSFKLRSGIYFHNGAALTAYDVQKSYEAFIAAGNTNPYTARLKMFIRRMEALDETTLAVESNYTGYMTLYAMTFPVVQASTIGDEFPRGTGPYWYVSYELDHALRLEVNPLWWKQAPTLDSIAFRYYGEVSEAIEGLQTNEIDLLSTRSHTAALSRRLSNLTAMDYGTPTYELLIPNLGSGSSMADVNVRQAVMYAIDRSVLASNAYLDMAIQSEVPVLPGTWLYESQSAKYYYSPERALQLLYDSGWADLTGDTMLNKLDGIHIYDLEVNIITYNDTTSSIRENAAETIAAYLNAVGIETKVEVLSYGDVAERIEDRDYDLALIGVNLSEIPVLMPLLGSDGSLNFNNYSNEAMDALILQTATAQTEEELRQIYSDIQLTLVERLPIMGLLFRTGTLLSTRSLGGLTGIREMNAFRGMEYITE